MYERILIPTDGSGATEHAIEHGLGLAETYDATVHALYVIEPVPAMDYGAGQIQEALQAEGERATADIVQRATERGLSVETDIHAGTPHSVILDYVDEHDIDLVVMGTHGRTGLERYLLGSVTEKVVRIAEVPVLTVSVPDTETEAES